MHVCKRLHVLLLFPAFLLTGCPKPATPKAEAPPAPVVVATVIKKTVPIQVRTIGTVKVVATVAVRPRVGGQLTGVFFQEGDDVKKHQKLFTIDPRPYEAAVKLAQANLAKNRALHKRALQDLTRTENLWRRGAETEATLEAARTAVESAQASVEADEAAVNAAQIQANYTTISSPLDGRVGELLVDIGNMVEANTATPLVVINQVSPIEVTFALPEQQLPAVAAARRERPLKVEAYLRNGEPPIPGQLAFVDNAVNTGTGTVQLKGEFKNADGKLWPGQFVDVALTIHERAESVVVPQAAIQSGQRGTYVFVITPEKKVELRPVVIAYETGEEVVIETGVQAGESVVTEGQIRLTNGTKVDVKAGNAGVMATAPAPAGGAQ